MFKKNLKMDFGILFYLPWYQPWVLEIKKIPLINFPYPFHNSQKVFNSGKLWHGKL
jgi:hypothetical protein